MRAQLSELQQTIEAIRTGGVDSLVIGPPGQEQVYALASADRPYRLIVDAMNEGAATISARGVILDANPRLGSMTGQNAAELVGTPVADLIPAVHRPAFARLLDVGAGSSARDEMDLTGPGGTTVPVLLAVAGFDLDGMLLRCLVLTDLTAQRAAEHQAAEAHQEIRAAAAYNRSLIEANLNPMVTIGLDGTINDVNTATELVTGYRRAELLGTEFSSYFTEPDLARASYERVFRDGSARDYPLELRHRDGHITSVLYNAAVYRDPAGKVRGVFAAARDVTEAKCTQSALRASEAEVRALNTGLEARVRRRTAALEQANKELQAFSYSVAHDLRTPLRGLSGFSGALLEEYGEFLGEKGRGYAGRIQAASERMGTIIDDLLHLAQVSRADMNLEPVDLSAEVVAIARGLQSGEPGRRVQFAIEDGVWVTADRILIRAVVRELVENAWKFTAQRDGASIEFAAEAADDGGTCCYVRDNGAGFDPAYVHKLFKPFQRLHTLSEFPGTGIGLARVQRIIERHGGRTWAEGAIDGGATFYFTLDAKVGS